MLKRIQQKNILHTFINLLVILSSIFNGCGCKNKQKDELSEITRFIISLSKLVDKADFYVKKEEEEKRTFSENQLSTLKASFKKEKINDGNLTKIKQNLEELKKQCKKLATEENENSLLIKLYKINFSSSAKEEFKQTIETLKKQKERALPNWKAKKKCYINNLKINTNNVEDQVNSIRKNVDDTSENWKKYLQLNIEILDSIEKDLKQASEKLKELLKNNQLKMEIEKDLLPFIKTLFQFYKFFYENGKDVKAVYIVAIHQRLHSEGIVLLENYDVTA